MLSLRFKNRRCKWSAGNVLHGWPSFTWATRHFDSASLASVSSHRIDWHSGSSLQPNRYRLTPAAMERVLDHVGIGEFRASLFLAAHFAHAMAATMLNGAGIEL
jgi:hypothetical protein